LDVVFNLTELSAGILQLSTCLSAVMLADFAKNAPPMPLVFVIAASAEQVQDDSTETGLGKVSLHGDLCEFSVDLLLFDCIHKGHTCGPKQTLQRNQRELISQKRSGEMDSQQICSSKA
jgi:hypothetical protein